MTFKSLISKIGTTGKAVSAVVVIVTTAYGATNFIYKQAYKKAQEDSKNIMIEQDVKDIKTTTDSILIAVKRQEVKINDIVLKQDEQKEAYNGLREQVVRHISKDKSITIDEFRQLLESAPELKKNLSQIGSSQ